MSALAPTLTGLQRDLRAGALSCDEALSAQRQRLTRLAPRWPCVVQTLSVLGPGFGPDNSPDGGPLSSPSSHPLSHPLSGIGLAHKDIFETSGRRPGVGHDCGQAAPGVQNAAAIASLERAGASHLASLTMAEYACGATSHNPRFAPLPNPLHARAVVGGSSSGSAVAVACEMVYGALGTDTAGSVRIPAATCGLLGLKTTHGLVSSQGVFALAPSLDGVGLLTRSAADAQQMLAALVPPAQRRPVLAQPRLKAWLPEAGLHRQVASALQALARDFGFDERLPLLPEHRELTALSEIVLHSEVATTHRTGLLDGTLAAGVESVALPGLVIEPRWYQAALRERSARVRSFVQAHLQEHDILLLPALPQLLPDVSVVTPGSPDFDVRQLLALHAFMGFVNYLGLPSVVIPIARDERGLPISAQLIARPFEEQTLLALADRIERQYFGADGFTRHFFKPEG